MNESPSILGATKPDRWGQLLGTGYQDFQSPTGIQGLAKWKDRRIDILMVMTKTPGNGHFREFIKQCKDQFDSIFVWEIFNPIVETVLLRYGFESALQIEGDGEILMGMKWERKNR